MLNVLRRWTKAPASPGREPRGERAAQPPPHLVGIGHSHLNAMLEFDWHRCQQPGARPSRYSFIQLLAKEEGPTLLPDETLNPGLRQRIEAARGAVPAPLFACVSGNEYHYLGLVDHPRPFDFTLPFRPDIERRPGAEVIPYGLMRRTMAGQMQGGLAVIRALRAAVAGPVLVVQSPPPVADDAWILAHPITFAEQLARHGVAPAALRLKLWLLQSDLYREACEEAGFRFLPPPEAACDPQGFLLRPGWREDPVHANSWYGRLVLDQVDHVLSASGTGAA